MIRCSGATRGDLAIAEGDLSEATLHLLVQGVAGEEEVDRGAFPLESHLALLCPDEDVDVDVARRPRRSVIGEREGAAEGVGDSRLLQLLVDGGDGRLHYPSSWLGWKRPSGSYLALSARRRSQVSGGKAASKSVGSSQKLM